MRCGFFNSIVLAAQIAVKEDFSLEQGDQGLGERTDFKQ
jgi:hypothetical protein